MSIKKVYSYNESGVYMGTSDAQESPLEPGVYLMPKNSTDIEPPQYKETEEFLLFKDNAWTVHKVVPVGMYYNCNNPCEDILVVQDGKIIPENLPARVYDDYTQVRPIIDTPHQSFNRETQLWGVHPSIIDDVETIYWFGDDYALNSKLTVKIKNNAEFDVEVGSFLHSIFLSWVGIKEVELKKRKEKKSRELSEVIDNAKFLTLKYKDFSVKQRVEQCQEVAIRKFTNGDESDYDIDSHGVSLTNVTKEVSHKIQSFCEKVRTDIRAFGVHYQKRIEDCQTTIEVDSLEFLPVTMRGELFGINHNFEFVIQESEKIKIVRTIE